MTVYMQPHLQFKHLSRNDERYAFGSKFSKYCTMTCLNAHELHLCWLKVSSTMVRSQRWKMVVLDWYWLYHKLATETAAAW